MLILLKVAADTQQLGSYSAILLLCSLSAMHGTGMLIACEDRSCLQVVCCPHVDMRQYESQNEAHTDRQATAQAYPCLMTLPDAALYEGAMMLIDKVCVSDSDLGPCTPMEELSNLSQQYSTPGAGLVACMQGADVPWPAGAPGFRYDTTAMGNFSSDYSQVYKLHYAMQGRPTHAYAI